MAVWQKPEDDESHRAWARETASILEQWSLGGAYANYMGADEPLERMQASFGDDLGRLQGLKSRYDPDNVLRWNQNILPP